MNRPLTIVGLILGALLAPCASAQTAPNVPIQQRLSEEFARAVYSHMLIEPLTLEVIETTTLLVQEAASVDPENVENWRLMLAIGKLAEREDLIDRAVDNIVRLDPGDDSARLMRCNRSIEKHQTADDRIKAYETLLAPDNIDRIGASVASRLALDLALLQRRVGNTAGFTDALTRALAWDSANHTAAALAAGYFRANVKDAFALTELLVNVVLSNPTDIHTLVDLARVLLENGAYNSAARIYDLAVNSTKANGQIPDTDLIIDQAIARWAQGDARLAMEILNKRVMAIDDDFRKKVRSTRPEMQFEEFAKILAPKDPALTTAQAVISTSEDAKIAAAFAKAAVEAYQMRLTAMAEAATSKPADASASQPAVVVPPEDIAATNLEAAWVTIWLAKDADLASTFIAAAEKIQPLSESARKRFDGWVALRKGEAARAAEVLKPLADQDPAARLGLALALQEQKQARDAALELLAVARAQPGSLIGIWAADRLLGMIGQRAPISDVARRMDELIATIPQTLDRAPVADNTAMSLRVEVPRETLNAYDPIVVLIKITNNTSMPLAIDRDGPLRPQLLLSVSASAANLPTLGDLPPLVIDLERQYRLEPRQTLVIPVDLRRYGVGQLLNNIARNGSILSFRGYLNFYATENGALKPGLYGCDVSAPPMRVEGVRATPDWIRETLAMLAAPEFPNQAGVLQRMALLGHRIGSRVRANATDEERQLLVQAGADLATAFAKLDEKSQAWLLAAIPHSTEFEPVLDVARKSDSRLVQVTYLLTQAAPGDSVVEAAKASTDQSLRRFAEFLDAKLQKAATQPQANPAPTMEGTIATMPEEPPASQPEEAPQKPKPKPTSRPLSLPPSTTPPPTDSSRP